MMDVMARPCRSDDRRVEALVCILYGGYYISEGHLRLYLNDPMHRFVPWNVHTFTLQRSSIPCALPVACAPLRSQYSALLLRLLYH